MDSDSNKTMEGKSSLKSQEKAEIMDSNSNKKRDEKSSLESDDFWTGLRVSDIRANVADIGRTLTQSRLEPKIKMSDEAWVKKFHDHAYLPLSGIMLGYTLFMNKQLKMQKMAKASRGVVMFNFLGVTAGFFIGGIYQWLGHAPFDPNVNFIQDLKDKVGYKPVQMQIKEMGLEDNTPKDTDA